MKCMNAGNACDGKEACKPLREGKIPDCPYFEPDEDSLQYLPIWNPWASGEVEFHPYHNEELPQTLLKGLLKCEKLVDFEIGFRKCVDGVRLDIRLGGDTLYSIRLDVLNHLAKWFEQEAEELERFAKHFEEGVDK